MTTAGPSPGPGPISVRARTYALIGLAGLAALSALVYGIARGARKETSASTECPISAALRPTLSPLAKGQVAAMQIGSAPRPFPDAAFQGPSGEPLTASSFHGKTILMNLWATWCIPCRQEMPALDQLQAKLGGPDFEVVAVDVDTARLERRRPFLQQTGVKALTFYADPTAQILRTLREVGPVIGLPTSFLIGPDGCEIGAMLGPASWASADAMALIGAAARPPASKS